MHLQSPRWTSCILSPHGRSRAFCAGTEGKPFAAPHASCWDASLGHNVTQNKHNLHLGLPLRLRNFLTSSFWPISPTSFHTILFKLKLSQRLYTESQPGTQNSDYKYKRHFILLPGKFSSVLWGAAKQYRLCRPSSFVHNTTRQPKNPWEYLKANFLSPNMFDTKLLPGELQQLTALAPPMLHFSNPQWTQVRTSWYQVRFPLETWGFT